ncbi:MAG: AsmA family protein [Methylococcales bacterium]
MKNPLKIILSIIAALVLLVLLVVCAGVFFINPNNFKPEIIAAVKNKTGRDLGIDGDLKLTVFPSLGVTTGKITLSNAQGFEAKNFAYLEESHINVALLPLLSKKVQVGDIALKGLMLNLTTNHQGVTNWDDLTAKKTPASVTNSTPSTQQIAATAAVETAAALSKLSIGNVTLTNTQINWQNQQTGQNYVFKDVSLASSKARFNQPISINIGFITLNPDTNITQTQKLDTILTINEQLDTVAFSDTNLQTITAGESIPNKSMTSSLTIASGAVSMPQQTVKVTGLQLKSGDLNLSADVSSEHFKEANAVFQGSLSIAQFSPAKLIKDFAIPVPAMRDANALNKFALSLNFTATQNSIDLQNLVLNLDDTLIKGSVSFNNFAFAIAFNLAIDNIDVDRYSSPAEKSKPANVSPLLALTAGVAVLPVDLLRKLDANGDLVVGSLKANGMNLQDVHLHVGAKNGLVTTTQSIKQFYQGEYASNFSVDVRQPKTVLEVDQKLDHVQIEPLLTALGNKATIRGTLDSSLQLQGYGNTPAELQSSLSGQLKFLCKDGAMLGFNLQNMIDKGKALLKGSDLAAITDNKETPFLMLGGSAVIAKGIVTNDDLELKTNKVQATGKGTVNLLNQQLNYKLTALLPKDSVDPADADLLHNTPMVILVGGTLSKPTYTLDVTALVTDKAKAKIESVINNAQTEEGKAKIEKALDKLKPEEKEKLKELAPKVGKLFKKFF